MITQQSVHLYSRYFDIYKTRSVNSFMSSSLFQYQNRKKEDMNVRLQYEFNECRDKGGKVYFYTLTYNDKHVPYFLNHNCPDYNDIRYLLHDSNFLHEVNSFGYDLRYFIAAERGSGGYYHNKLSKRGYSNNPHYHCIFFLYPLNDPSPICLIDLVRKYWQGKELMYIDDIRRCKDAKFGFVQDGGVLLTTKALTYCSKYIIKDLGQKDIEDEVFSSAQHSFLNGSLWSRDLYNKYLLDYHFFNSYLEFRAFRNRIKRKVVKGFDEVIETIKNKEVIAAFDYASDILKLYRNRFSTRCRYSRALGYNYAKKDIDQNILSPKCFVCTESNTHKQKPVPLGFMRKVYYNCLICPDGSNRYVLNDLGRLMRVSKFFNELDSNVSVLYCKALSCVNNRILNRFDLFCSKFNFCYNSKDLISLLLKLKRDVVKLYLVYNRIYKDRFTIDTTYSLNYKRDYEFFLSIPYQYAFDSYNLIDVDKLFTSDLEYNKFKKYSQHETFKPYILVFNFLDCLFDFLSYEKDLFDMEEFKKNEVSRLTINKYKK